MLVVVGCTNTDADQISVVQNESTWSMPLDEFKVFNPELSNYAEQLLIGKCLESAGYEWPVPWQDPDFPLPETMNPNGVRIFNVDIATQYGYHDAPPPNLEGALAWAQFTKFANSYEPDNEFAARFEVCGEEARGDETELDVAGLNYIAGLEIQASDLASSDAAVVEAARSWKECFSEVVAFDLPNDPQTEMPTPSMAEEFGIYGPELTEKASAEEIVIAEADAKCRLSSGYNETRYQAEWKAQQALLSKNRDKLDGIRSDALKNVEEMQTTIAENPPSS